jgi:MoxR-like ATPase
MAMVNHTRESPYLSLGVSPRGGIMLFRAAQGMAFLDSRTFATPDDFKALAVNVFAHRVVVSGRYSSTLKKSQQGEEILREIVDGVPVPM